MLNELNEWFTLIFLLLVRNENASVPLAEDLRKLRIPTTSLDNTSLFPKMFNNFLNKHHFQAA